MTRDRRDPSTGGEPSTGGLEGDCQPTRRAEEDTPAVVREKPAGLLRFFPLGDGNEMSYDVLVAPTVSVGRSSRGQVVVDDEWVSRRHAVLESRPGAGWTIHDKSENGLFVGGQRTSGTTLVGGEIIRMGGTLWLFFARGRGLTLTSCRLAVPATVHGLVGGPRLDEVRRVLNRFADAEMTVLISGATGTGKEVAAKYMHLCSRRRAGPFMAVNCAALPAELFESQLFGHRRGAFSGAQSDSPGYFRSAQKGTLFLDEIGDLPLPLQAKLLRALQTRQVIPLGSSAPEDVDVRVVCATNVELDRAVSAGRFRRDLYGRINGLELTLPPLSERREDIGLLATHFLSTCGGGGCRLSPEAMDLLANAEWPENIRQLEHAIRRAVLLAPTGGVLGVELFEPVKRRDRQDQDTNGLLRGGVSASDPLSPSERSTRTLTHDALVRHEGHAKRAAKDLGISRSQLYRRAQKLGLDVGSYRRPRR